MLFIALVALKILQLLNQGPAADKALVQQRENGRTLENGLSKSPPRTSAGLVIKGPPK